MNFCSSHSLTGVDVISTQLSMTLREAPVQTRSCHAAKIPRAIPRIMMTLATAAANSQGTPTNTRACGLRLTAADRYPKNVTAMHDCNSQHNEITAFTACRDANEQLTAVKCKKGAEKGEDARPHLNEPYVTPVAFAVPSCTSLPLWRHYAASGHLPGSLHGCMVQSCRKKRLLPCARTFLNESLPLDYAMPLQVCDVVNQGSCRVASQCE